MLLLCKGRLGFYISNHLLKLITQPARVLASISLSDDRNGKIPVVAVINGGPHKQIVRFGNQFRVRDDAATVQALKEAGYDAHAEVLVSS
ncbi:hypothetical protein IQ266_16325 [filamentous cyanobacterium LEGE 11480]|uniref:Uncharacterized protein n=1 Tax=Romeriopsis navalis LEGE 11480 TaxID=2777977 RepID=A0A928VPC7_9CYAN|nr:hypothetical protein [Romeriopsis navalis]MBE9031302.1 hypothetical protein [Romeriopsis navalis LEGE 11480]